MLCKLKGSSEFAMTERAVVAIVNTYLSGCMGGISWVITEMLLKRTKKISLFGLCSGLITGCSCVTPACGFISAASSLAFGAIGGILCCIVSEKKRILKRYDDVCDVFASMMGFFP